MESGVSAKERRRSCFVKRNERKLRKRNRRVEYYVGMKEMNDKRSNKEDALVCLLTFIEVKGLTCYG